MAGWSQGVVHTCSPVLGSAANRQSSSYVRLGERGSNSVLGTHIASISATKAIPFFSPLCEHWGQGLRLADIYKMSYRSPGCLRLLCGAWSLVGVDIQDLSQRCIHMPLPQASLQINFFQGPDKPDMLQPLLRNPCIPLLVFPHEAKALCREDFHLPLISGPLLSAVSLGQESTPHPKLLRQPSVNQAQIVSSISWSRGAPYGAIVQARSWVPLSFHHRLLLCSLNLITWWVRQHPSTQFTVGSSDHIPVGISLSDAQCPTDKQRFFQWCIVFFCRGHGIASVSQGSTLRLTEALPEAVSLSSITGSAKPYGSSSMATCSTAWTTAQPSLALEPTQI